MSQIDEKLKAFRLGNLNFTIKGANEIRLIVEDELKSIATQSEPDPGCLNFNFTSDLQIPRKGTRIAKPIVSWIDGFAKKGGGVSHSLEPTRNVATVAWRKTAGQGFKKKVQPKWLKKARNWNYLSAPEEASKNFMYDVFDYITQIHNVKANQTYLHASSFEKNGEGVAICAWGGIGKTTSMLKMILESGWTFLSDDLAILDSKGKLWRSPKKMQIYAYNLLGQKELSDRLLDGRNIIDLASWKYNLRVSGVDGVRRRISAEELFKSDTYISKMADLARAFYAERASCTSFSCKELDLNEFCDRCSSVVMKEIEPFSQILASVNASGFTHLLPSFSKLKKQTADIIKSGFEASHVKPYLWTIPEEATPEEIHRDLLKRLS